MNVSRQQGALLLSTQKGKPDDRLVRTALTWWAFNTGLRGGSGSLWRRARDALGGGAHPASIGTGTPDMGTSGTSHVADVVVVEHQLRSHEAMAPKALANDVTLLDRLPIAIIDLSDLATDRLRRFLGTFHVEIHYDGLTRRARVQAQISAEFVDRLAQTVGRATRPVRPRITT